MSEVKYDFNVEPYYDTTVSELEKGYVQFLAVDGQQLQNRELNVAQGLLRGNIRQVTNQIFSDGTIIDGCNFTNNTTDQICILSKGKIYLNGVIVVIPETKWTYSTDDNVESQIPNGKIVIYADVLPTIVTSNDDASLNNPASNYESYGNSGGHRLKYVAKAYCATEEQFSDLLKSDPQRMLVPLINVYDRESEGPIKEDNLIFDKVYQQMRQRTYDQSGDFIASGLNVTAKRYKNDPENYYQACVSAGRCYVQGYQFNIVDTKREVRNSSINVDSTSNLGISEKFNYVDPNSKYYLNHSYTKSVQNVVGPIVIQQNKTRNAVSNIDEIVIPGKTSSQILGVSTIYKNNTTMETYIKKQSGVKEESADWDYDNSTPSQIRWNTKYNRGPIPGKTYYANVIYSDILIEEIDYTINKDRYGTYVAFTGNKELAPDYVVSIDYSWYLPRIDLVYVDINGNVKIKMGTPSDTSVLIKPNTPAVGLPLAYIYVIPDREPYNWNVVQYGLYRVPVGQLQDLKKRIDTLEYNATMTALESQIQDTYLTTENSNAIQELRNIYTDPLTDYSKADMNSVLFDSTIDIYKRAVVLPMDIHQITCDNARIRKMVIGNNNKITYDVIDPHTENITGIDYQLNDDNSIKKIITSQQVHATVDEDLDMGRTIDIAPFLNSSLTPRLICEPARFVDYDDTQTSTVESNLWSQTKVTVQNVGTENSTINTTTYGGTTITQDGAVIGKLDNFFDDSWNQSAITSKEVINSKSRSTNIWSGDYRLETETNTIEETGYYTESSLEINNTTDTITTGQSLTYNADKSSLNKQLIDSVLSNIVTPYLKVGKKIKIIGKQFPANTEIQLKLDGSLIEPVYDSEYGIYNDNNLPMRSGVSADISFNTITNVQRPYVWRVSQNSNGTWKFTHPTYKKNGITYGIEYTYDYSSNLWTYKLLDANVSGSADLTWNKKIVRSPWYYKWLESQPQDIDIINAKKNNQTDPATGRTLNTKNSGIKTTIITDPNGYFECYISIPEQTMSGQHTVTAESTIPASVDKSNYKTSEGSFNGIMYFNQTVNTNKMQEEIVYDETMYQTTINNTEYSRTANVVNYTLVYDTETQRWVYDPDPVGQTFKVDQDQYLIALDIYFAQIPDINSSEECIPWVAIREVKNGVPDENMLYYQTIDKSIIKSADDINVSDTNSTGYATIPTHIEFTKPIFVSSDKTYMFTLGTNIGDKYYVYYSKLGENDITTGKAVLYQKQQSLEGVMMVSSNNGVWDSSYQDSDIKYTLYKPKFKTSKTIYIDNIETNLTNFSSLNVTMLKQVFENTGINLFYTINYDDITSENNTWIQIPFDQLVTFTYNDNYNNGMKLGLKLDLWTNDEDITPIVNLDTLEIHLSKFKSNGEYLQNIVTVSN